MQHTERPSTIIVIVVTLVLAGMIGLAIPLASGSRPSRGQTAWQSPTPAPPTVPAPAVTATAPARQPTIQPATIAPTAMRRIEPATPRAPFTKATATQRTTSTATQTAPATTTPPATASTTLPPGTPGTRLRAVVAVDLLNLRAGPGQGFGVIGLARSGETYTATARSGDGTWLQICCHNQAPAWLATGMVTVTGRLANLPVTP
jgi:uncharacterized protein YgiM (DUF1202 family)